MAKQRVFTVKELKDMATLPDQVALEAIEAGDKDRAKESIKRMHDDAQKIVDSYLSWVADLMDYIYVKYGEAEFEKALRKRFDRSESQKAARYDKMDFRTRVQTQAATLRALLQPLEITEDDEKVSIKMNPCGSGQRLVQSGAYEPPRSISRMKPQPLTWGKPDFPLYCSHGALQEIINIETLGYPTYVHEIPDKVGTEPCLFNLYKDPGDIPEAYYQRVGLKKPKKKT
jgi:hypothetical protein